MLILQAPSLTPAALLQDLQITSLSTARHSASQALGPSQADDPPPRHTATRPATYMPRPPQSPGAQPPQARTTTTTITNPTTSTSTSTPTMLPMQDQAPQQHPPHVLGHMARAGPPAQPHTTTTTTSHQGPQPTPSSIPAQLSRSHSSRSDPLVRLHPAAIHIHMQQQQQQQEGGLAGGYPRGPGWATAAAAAAAQPPGLPAARATACAISCSPPGESPHFYSPGPESPRRGAAAPPLRPQTFHHQQRRRSALQPGELSLVPLQLPALRQAVATLQAANRTQAQQGQLAQLGQLGQLGQGQWGQQGQQGQGPPLPPRERR